jgi:hypothetical protein
VGEKIELSCAQPTTKITNAVAGQPRQDIALRPLDFQNIIYFCTVLMCPEDNSTKNRAGSFLIGRMKPIKARPAAISGELMGPD